MLRRSEEVIKEEEAGVLHSGKKFRLSGVNITMTNTEESVVLPKEVTTAQYYHRKKSFGSKDNDNLVLE